MTLRLMYRVVSCGQYIRQEHAQTYPEREWDLPSRPGGLTELVNADQGRFTLQNSGHENDYSKADEKNRTQLEGGVTQQIVPGF